MSPSHKSLSDPEPSTDPNDPVPSPKGAGSEDEGPGLSEAERSSKIDAELTRLGEES